MILPTIIVSSEEALRAVPQSLREGSLALGATQWQTIYKNVLPYSLPGMLTGSILGVGRAAGETAPILLTVAAFFLPKLPRSVFDQVMALPYHLYILATQHPDVEKVRPMQYGTALVLLVLVLGVSLGAIVLRSHFRRKYRW
jgi:phosphate transport system permease protein